MKTTTLKKQAAAASARTPKNKPLPTKAKKAASTANKATKAAGDAALVALGTHGRGQSKMLIGKVGNIEAIDDKIRALRKQRNAELADCKQNGFSRTAVNAVVKMRQKDPAEVAHAQEEIAIVKEGLGMQLTFWEKQAIGEEPSEAELDASEAERINPEDVARARAADSSLAVDKTETAAVH